MIDFGKIDNLELDNNYLTDDFKLKKKWSKKLRVFINVITFSLYGRYIKNRMFKVALKIRTIFNDQMTTAQDREKLASLSAKLQKKISGKYRHISAVNILSTVKMPALKEYKEEIVKPFYRFASEYKQQSKKECLFIVEACEAFKKFFRSLSGKDKDLFKKKCGLYQVPDKDIIATIDSMQDELAPYSGAFTGEFLEVFDEIEKKPFKGSNGVKEVEMLHQKVQMRYGEIEGFKIVEKNYRVTSGKNLCFVAILPPEDEDFEELEEELLLDSIMDLRKELTLQTVDLYLPPFSPANENVDLGLKGAAISSEDAFNRRAQNTVFPQKAQFCADRPFFYMVCLGDQIVLQGSVKEA